MDTYRQVLPPNYLCVDAERPLIDCECPVTDVVPKLPDLPSFDDSGRRSLWLIGVGAIAIALIVVLLLGIYQRRKERRKIFCIDAEGNVLSCRQSSTDTKTVTSVTSSSRSP